MEGNETATQAPRTEHAIVAEPPLAAISILNWNGWQDTLECLESVRQLDYPNYLTVVVDNGSWNGSADKIKGWAEANLGPGHVLADYTRETALAGGIPETEQTLDCAPSPARMVLIRNEENLGFTGGNNVSIQYSLKRSPLAEYIFLLNNDARIASDCVDVLVGTARSNRAGIVGAGIRSSQGDDIPALGCDESTGVLRRFIWPFRRWTTPQGEHAQEFKPMLWASGAAMLISAKALIDIRSFRGHFLDDRLFAYGDEVELCHSARATGHKVLATPRAVVYHQPCTSSGGGVSPVAYYYMNRNRLFTAQRELPHPWRALFHATNAIACLIRVAKNLAEGRPRSARAIALGLLDGYRGVTGKWKCHDEEVLQKVFQHRKGTLLSSPALERTRREHH